MSVDTFKIPISNSLRASQRSATRIRELRGITASSIACTHPDEVKRRRTILVIRRSGQSFGFTLQTYGIHNKRDGEIELLTYVDNVDPEGPAAKAGMRAGDVILSINGHDMQLVDHKTLVQFIQNCSTTMRMEVLFEDCVRKIELNIRKLEFERILREKLAELSQLEAEERALRRSLRETGNYRNSTSGFESTDDEEMCGESPSLQRSHSTASSTEVLVRRNVMATSRSETKLLNANSEDDCRGQCSPGDNGKSGYSTATLPRMGACRGGLGYSLPCSRQLTPKTSFEVLAEQESAPNAVEPPHDDVETSCAIQGAPNVRRSSSVGRPKSDEVTRL